jgi:hypothetical protein
MGLLDTTMEMAKLAGKIANPELVREAMKANTEALAMSRENLELHKRVLELETKLKELKAQRDMTEKVFRKGGYVFVDGDPDVHCSRCWDADRKLIHLHSDVRSGNKCPACETKHYRNRPVNPKRNDPDSVPAW